MSKERECFTCGKTFPEVEMLNVRIKTVFVSTFFLCKDCEAIQIQEWEEMGFQMASESWAH